MKQYIKHILTLMCLAIAITANAQTYKSGTWYSLYAPSQFFIWTIGSETFDVFAPTDGKLTYSYYYSGIVLKNNKTYVYESSDGGSSYGSAKNGGTSTSSKSENINVSVSENINKIKIDRPTGNTNTVYYSNLKIKLKKHILLASGTYGTTSLTKSFGSQIWGTCSTSQTVNFRSFLTNGNITITISGTDADAFSFSNTQAGVNTLSSSGSYSYAVGSNACASENGSGACSTGHLGKSSNYDFNVYFYPQQKHAGKTCTATITITDGTSTATVTLKGTCSKRGQTIQNFSTTAQTINTTADITYAAYTTDNTTSDANNLDVAYTSNNESVATVVNNKLNIITSGTVTITASQSGNTYYNVASSKSVTYTINKVTPTLTAPTIESGLTYVAGEQVQDHFATAGEARNDKNEVVEGTFTCTDELTACHNGTPYTITFNPTNTAWYNSNTCTASATLSKANQTITWTDNEGDWYDGASFTATASSGLTVQYRSSDTSIADIDEGSLVVKQIGTVTIEAYQEGDCNYNAATSLYNTITVYFAPTVIAELPVANSITFGQTLENATLTGGKAIVGDTEIDGTFAWSDPATQPNAGNNPFEVTFTPDDRDKYAQQTCMVVVIVNKATPVVSWYIGSTLREKTTYGSPVVTNNTENDYSISLSNLSVSGIATYASSTLTTHELGTAASATFRMTITQAASNNYNAVNEYRVFTVLPKSKACLPLDLSSANSNAQDDYENALYGKEGKTVEWCNTNDNGYHENFIWPVDVRYTQRYGIALGNYTEGLEGLSLTGLWDLMNGRRESAWSTKRIVLNFTGVPDRISFSTYTQTVTSIGGVFSVEANYNATFEHWQLEESADGTHWTTLVTTAKNENRTINQQLDRDTRYVRITYKGNFTGYVTNLKITRRHYLTTEPTNITFATETLPLQEPKQITVNYCSIGECDSENDSIKVETDNPAFYADYEKITQQVGFDQYGSYKLTIRCTDVGQEGNVILTGSDGTQTLLPVSSENPVLTSSNKNTLIFRTGTERSYLDEEHCYQGYETHSFADCFSGSAPLFDTLYILGVTGNTDHTFESYNAAGTYLLPRIDVPDNSTACNANTPCFVYYKSGNSYVHQRTFDAANERLGCIAMSGAKVAIMGYAPYAYTGYKRADNGFLCVKKDADVYLINAEITSRCHTQDGSTNYQATAVSLNRGDNQVGGSGSVICVEPTEASLSVGLHVSGNNTLKANTGLKIASARGYIEGENINSGISASLQGASPVAVVITKTDRAATITINDTWVDSRITDGELTLIPTNDMPAVDLGNYKGELHFTGAVNHLLQQSEQFVAAYRCKVSEQNGQAAVLYGTGEMKTDCKVYINGGTFYHNALPLRLPAYSIVDGGVFNSGDLKIADAVRTYQTATSEGASPVNTSGEKLNRQRQTNKLGLGQSIFSADDGAFYPLKKTEQVITETIYKQWVTVTPNHDDIASENYDNKRLLYVEVLDGLRSYASLPSKYKSVRNNSAYNISNEQYMLLQINRADEWRMLTAPFDVNEVYVIELSADAASTRSKAMSDQYEQQKLLFDSMSELLTAERLPDMSFTALLSTYMQDHADMGIFPLEHYYGDESNISNVRNFNYYLYQTGVGNSNTPWEVINDELQTTWIEVPDVGKDGILMHAGKSYAMNFLYCPMCEKTDKYDYWSGKYLLLVGKSSQTLNAEATVEEPRLDITTAMLAGNSSYRNQTVSDDCFVYNPSTDMFEIKTDDEPLMPTETVLFAPALTATRGNIVGIQRTGKVMYANHTEDNHGNETNEGVTTDLNSQTEKVQEPRKVLINGQIYIQMPDNTIFDLQGRRVESL